MIYRCRTCRHEEPRGWLPTATSGLYAMALCALSVGGIAGIVGGLRAAVGPPAVAPEPVDSPWWVAALAVVLGLVVVVVGMAVVNFGLGLAEWLAFARRPCPACGARRWSWGFTRGFGA